MVGEYGPRPPGWLGGERVGLMTYFVVSSIPRLRQTFFPAYFRLSPLQNQVRKVVGGFGKESYVSTGVRKPGNQPTNHMCVTDRHEMTLGVKLALNPNTTNQSKQ